MSGLALTLVLISAFCHAYWNLAAKRASRGATFVFLFTLLSNIIYAPLALPLLLSSDLSVPAILFMMGNALLHITYFLLLTYGYKIGDLSLVYPLARGTGPMFSALAAVILLGERPSLLAVLGIVGIGVGVVVFSGGMRLFSSGENRAAIGFAVLTGLVIATYTIWDKYAVAELDLHPVLYDWFGGLLRTGFLWIYLRLSWDDVRIEWQGYRHEALIIAILSPLAYMLVLVALTFSPVSYIAPTREISILIGAVMGARLLAEGDRQRRLTAAAIMMIGLVMLALG